MINLNEVNTATAMQKCIQSQELHRTFNTTLSYLVNETEELNTLPEFSLRNQIRCNQLRRAVWCPGLCNRRRGNQACQEVVGVKV